MEHTKTTTDYQRKSSKLKNYCMRISNVKSRGINYQLLPCNNLCTTRLHSLSSPFSGGSWLDWQNSIQRSKGHRKDIYTPSWRSRICRWHMYTSTPPPGRTIPSKWHWNNSKENRSLHNPEITKSMRINANKQDPININNTVIEDAQNFTYLGSIESTIGGTDEDITARKKKA